MTISKMYGTAVFPEETASRDKPTKRIITFRAGGRKDCSMWSSAHRLSVRAVIDPTYSALEPSPAMLEADDRPYWHYEAEDFLLHRLETMQRNFVDAKRKVGWPGRFRPVRRTLVFQRSFDAPCLIDLRASGECTVESGGVAEDFPAGTFSCRVSVPGTVKITVRSDAIPALGSDLEWKILDGERELFARRLPRRKSGKFPHEEEIPEILLRPMRLADGSYDAGCELFGWLEADCDEIPRLGAGESRYEMENSDPELSEQDLEMIAVAPGRIRTQSPIAFRYFRFSGKQPENVLCRALFSPQQYHGAFAGTERQNALWMRSAYTLRLNMHHFLLDGIKRDHMPWTGDLALSLTSNAYVFGDGQIVKDSLTVLGCSGPEYRDVNGITDFSCWLPVCHELYQRYWGDREFLERSFPAIRERVNSLINRTDADCFLSRDLQWVFIDWTPGSKTSALQCLFYFALRSAARLAARLGASAEQRRWNEFAELLKGAIYKNCFSPETGLFRATLNPSEEEYTRHANLFALLSGMADEKDRAGLLKALRESTLPNFGTPFLQTWEMLVMAEAGHLDYFLERLEHVWGYMLDQDATTFWEGCGTYASEAEYCAFYGRPYGASLCHAWASGPAFLFPRIFLGLRPLEDGWKRFACRPCADLGDLRCTVPTPYGPIEAERVDGQLSLHHPPEIMLGTTSRPEDIP